MPVSGSRARWSTSRESAVPAERQPRLRSSGDDRSGLLANGSAERTIERIVSLRCDLCVAGDASAQLRASSRELIRASDAVRAIVVAQNLCLQGLSDARLID
jgi:hypothetical protein